MRIAFLVGEFPRVSETFIANQIAAVSARSHEVTLFAERRAPAGPADQDIAQLRLHGDPLYSPERPRSRFARVVAMTRWFLWGLRRRPLGILKTANIFEFGGDALSGRLLFGAIPWIDGGDFDAVHCHYGPNGLLAARLQAMGLCRAPIVTSFHGYDVNVVPRRKPRGYYSPLFRRGARFTVGSDFMRSRLIALGAPAERIVKLPAGVPLDRYGFRERDYHPGEEIRVLTVGRLVEAKGIDLALRAISRLRERFPGVRLDVVGDGPRKSNWVDLAQRLGMSGRVEWHGALSQERLRDLYAKAHLFVLSSRVARDGAEEGQGLVLGEAQACGLPVVSTRIGGIPESLVENRSGLLVPPDDEEELAAAIAWLLEHPEDWPRMGRAGRAHVEENFALDKLTDRLIALYEEVVRCH